MSIADPNVGDLNIPGDATTQCLTKLDEKTLDNQRLRGLSPIGKTRASRLRETQESGFAFDHFTFGRLNSSEPELTTKPAELVVA